MNNLIWIEISKSAIRHNIKVLRRLAGKNVILAPCVKANAYGHGLAGAAKAVLDSGADWVCVNSVDEGAILRAAKIKKPVLVIGFTRKKDLTRIIGLGLRATVYNYETAEILSGIARARNKKAKVHIKVDTGMSRQGVPHNEAVEFIGKVRRLPNIIIEGLLTHYACADDPEHPACFRRQLDNFKALIERLKAGQINIPYLHTANSAGTLLYKEAHFNFVRPGIAVYGYYPDKAVEVICKKKKILLKPSLTLKTKVAQVKTLPQGATVSYGCTFTAKRKTKMAVLPVGYYDGIDRKFSNRGEVFVCGKRAPILGRVCMNITVVDITNVNNVKPEEEAVIIGRQGKERITAEEVADNIGTINYEVTTRLRESIARIMVK